MSDTFDHESDAWDDLSFRDDDDDGVPLFTRAPSVTCRNCQKPGFRWKSTDAGWRLFSGEQMHSCYATPKDTP